MQWVNANGIYRLLGNHGLSARKDSKTSTRNNSILISYLGGCGCVVKLLFTGVHRVNRSRYSCIHICVVALNVYVVCLNN